MALGTLADLAAELAARSDAQLMRLLILRPDAMTPPVANFTDLASRLCSTQSINAALDQLVLPALLSLHRPSPQAAAWLPTLQELALVAAKETDDDGSCPFLPLPAVNLALILSPATDSAHMACASGTECGLTGMHLPFPALPPAPEMFAVSGALRDNAAGGAIETLLRTMTNLLELVSHTPVAVLRDGGVGVQALRKLSRTLDTEETMTGFYLELAAMARLISLDRKARHWVSMAESWLPLDRAAQWLELVHAWLDSNRGSAARPLAPELPEPGQDQAGRSNTVSIRRILHAAVLELTGRTPSRPAASSVRKLLDWRHPRLSTRYCPQIPGILREMELLGITGAGAPSGPGLALGSRLAVGPGLDLDPGGGTAIDITAAVAALLPEPIEHFVVQGDLTAIAAGFLAPRVGARLKRMAVSEGQGTASIFRFSQTSLERAMVGGESRESIRSFLAHHSRTALPQSLDYLIDAAAIRQEAAHFEAPARSAPPAGPDLQGASAVQSRSTAKARSTTHARSTAGGPAGRAPAAAIPAATVPGPAEIAAQIACLRSQPVGGGQDGGEAGPALVMEELRQAIKAGTKVWLRTVNSVGDVERVLVAPTSFEAGLLRSRLPGALGERRFSIHRIIAAEPATRNEVDLENRKGPWHE